MSRYWVGGILPIFSTHSIRISYNKYAHQQHINKTTVLQEDRTDLLKLRNKTIMIKQVNQETSSPSAVQIAESQERRPGSWLCNIEPPCSWKTPRCPEQNLVNFGHPKLTGIGQISGNLLKNQRTRRLGHHWALGQVGQAPSPLAIWQGETFSRSMLSESCMDWFLFWIFWVPGSKVAKNSLGFWNWTWILLREHHPKLTKMTYLDPIKAWCSLCPEVNVTEFLSNIKPKARDEPSMGRCLLPTSEKWNITQLLLDFTWFYIILHDFT